MITKSRVFEDVFRRENVKNEYLVILNNISSILINYTNLTNKQKLEHCNNQRYYMKLYLKEVLKCQ